MKLNDADKLIRLDGYWWYTLWTLLSMNSYLLTQLVCFRKLPSIYETEIALYLRYKTKLIIYFNVLRSWNISPARLSWDKE